MADAFDSEPQDVTPQDHAPEGGPPSQSRALGAARQGPAQARAGLSARFARRLFWPGGLSSRLLILTLLFVALARAVLLPAALASYEQQWLLDRVRAAELASLAVDAAPNQVVS